MPADRVTHITAVRSEYTSARHICANLEHRAHGRTYRRPPGYLPPAIDYGTDSGRAATIHVRDHDVRFLERVATRAATEHLDLIHRARLGEADAQAELKRHARRLQPEMSARFVKADLAEDAHVIPYTTERQYPVTEISSKGAVLLDLSRQGFATPDFTFLTASVYPLPPDERRRVTRRRAASAAGTKMGAAVSDATAPEPRPRGPRRNPIQWTIVSRSPPCPSLRFGCG